MMKFAAIIPARYASTRFPGKPLAILGGKPIIQRVFERVSSVVSNAYVATDDERIYNTVEQFGGNAIMTRTDHKSGTDRCWEAVSKLGADRFDVVINVQGDEPFILPDQIEAIQQCFCNPQTQIATLVKPFGPDDSWDLLENPNSPKVVTDNEGFALYFSRSVIPYKRGEEKTAWLRSHQYLRHIGLYAYRTDVLEQITRLPQSPLELTEKLEQLRWLQNGYRIKTGITHTETIGIDTPEDLVRAEQFLSKRK
jgi:3-deoxy-manno-octulosonate cytidylyltransferase (CMP-KDO synthetase)